jgi:hypothetical protein
VLRMSVRQIQSCAFAPRGAKNARRLCRLVHPCAPFSPQGKSSVNNFYEKAIGKSENNLCIQKRAGGCCSPEAQASLRALIIKNMQPGTWKFLSYAWHTAQQERFFGKRGRLRGSVALPGRLWEGDSSAEPGVSKDFQAPLCMSLIIKVLKGGRFLLPSPKATDLPNLSGAQISFCSGGRSAATP